MEKNDLVKKIDESTAAVRKALCWDQLSTKPIVGVVLGSGLGAYADSLSNSKSLSYADTPHLSSSTVPGHSSRWVVGTDKKGRTILAAQGRIHYYEGHDPATVTLPIRIMKALGLTNVVLTNACGSCNPEYRPGQFMLIQDQINFTGFSPLRGLHGEGLGEQFVDMSAIYDREIIAKVSAKVHSERRDLHVHTGTYIGVTGPQYESPAEIRAFGKLGADAVGMSTVAESITARQCKMTVSGISCITNFGAGLSSATLHHEEVAAMGKSRAADFTWLLETVIDAIMVD